MSLCGCACALQHPEDEAKVEEALDKGRRSQSCVMFDPQTRKCMVVKVCCVVGTRREIIDSARLQCHWGHILVHCSLRVAFVCPLAQCTGAEGGEVQVKKLDASLSELSAVGRRTQGSGKDEHCGRSESRAEHREPDQQGLVQTRSTQDTRM